MILLRCQIISQGIKGNSHSGEAKIQCWIDDQEVTSPNHAWARQTTYRVSWPNLTTKIITLWEFLNFVNEVSRLQNERSSDMLMHLEIFGGKCVSSMRKCIFISMYFHFIGVEKCFCSFLWIFRVYLWLHMRISGLISKRRDVATRTEGYIYRLEFFILCVIYFARIFQY
jgi:hypothetical protein